MDVSVEQIFGAALNPSVRDATAPQGVEAVVSPAPASQIVAEATSADDSPDSPETAPQTEPMCRMADMVNAAFRRNVAFRDSSGVSMRLQYALDVNTCTFSDEQIAALASVGIPRKIAEKMCTPLTYTKTRAAKALFMSAIHSVQEPLFEVSESPWPEVPDEVDAEVLASMMQDLTAIFTAIMKTRGNEPLSPEEEQVLMKAVADAPAKRRDEIYARRKEYASVRARRMQEKVWDIFIEGGGEKALAKCIADLCHFGTCFLIGPVPRVVAKNTCKKQKNGTVKYVREFSLKPVFESVSPLDCYPAPDAKQPSDGPFCIREKYTAETLWRFSNGGATREKNGEGWNEVVVRDILDRHPNGGVKIQTEPESEQKKSAEMNSGAGDGEDCTFEAVRCFLSVRGSELAEIGIVKNRDGKSIVIGDYYHVEAIVIDNKVVYCRILDARLDVPVSKACYYELPGSFWGESIADKLKFVQMMQNNTGKAMFLDLAATGPMFWVNNAQRLVNKSSDATTWAPYKTVAFGDEMYSPSGANGAPMGVLDIPTKAAQLIREWDLWQTQADNDSGIPRFAEGQTGGQLGALRTSGGLAQMSEHMMRGTDMSATQYDDGIIKTTTQRIADWILAYDDDMELKGDVFIRAVGIRGRILKAQLDQARLQFFQLVATSAYLQKLFPPSAVVAIARPIVRNLQINTEDALPSEEHVRWLEDLNRLAALAAAEQQAAGGAPGQGGGEPQPSPDAGIEPVAPQGGVAERRAVA